MTVVEAIAPMSVPGAIGPFIESVAALVTLTSEVPIMVAVVHR